jgi:hypothetical protein
MCDNHHPNLDRIEGSGDTIVPGVHHGGGGGSIQEPLQREQLLVPPPPPPSPEVVMSHFLQGVPVHTFVNVMEIPDPPTPECSKITVLSSPTPTSTERHRLRHPLQPYDTNTVHHQHHHPQRRRNSFSTYTTTNDDHHLSTITRKESSLVTQPPPEHRTFTSCESHIKRRSSMCHMEFPVGGGTSELRRHHHPSSSSSSLHAAPSLDSSASAEEQVVWLLQPPPLKQRRRSSVPLPIPLPSVLPTFAPQQIHVASLGSVEDPARMIITLPPTVDTPNATTIVESAQLPSLLLQVTDTIAFLREIRALVHAYRSVKNTKATAETQMEATDERRSESTVTHPPEHSPNDDDEEEEQVVQQIRALTGYVIVPSLSALYTNPSVESHGAPHNDDDDNDDDDAAARKLQQQQERQRRFRRYMGNGPDVRTMERNKQAAVECIRNTMRARYERNKPPTNSSSSSSTGSGVFYRYYDIPTGQRITSEEYEQRYLHMLQQTSNIWGTYFTHLHQSQPRHAPLYHYHPETAVVVDPDSSDTSIRGGGVVVVVDKKMKDVEPPSIPPISCRTSRVAVDDDDNDATTVMMTTPQQQQQQQMQQAAEERLWDAIDVALEIYSQEILQIRDHGHKNTK